MKKLLLPLILTLATPPTYIALRQIAGGAAGNIPISNGTNLVSQPLTGDASVTSGGVITVSQINGNAVPTGVAAGDLLSGTAANTLSRLPIGSSGRVLTVVSGLPAWTNITTVPPGATSGEILYNSSNVWTLSGSAINWNGSTCQITPASGAVAFQGIASSGAVIALETSSSSTNTRSPQRLGQINFQGKANSILANGAGLTATAAATWSSGSSPGDLIAQTTPSGSVVLTNRGRWTAAGSFYSGDGSPLSTSATSGHIRIPTCAGMPTGTPEGGAGSLVCDTTDNQLWGYGSDSVWHWVGGNQTVIASAAGTHTLAVSEAGIWRAARSLGQIDTLPPASGNKGLTYTIYTASTGGATITPNGADTINGAPTTITVAAGPGHAKTLVSDGTSDWAVTSSV